MGPTSNSVEQAAADQVLSFFVGGAEYGVPILRVRELVGSLAITRVPSAPAFVRGVANLRGRVVPVVDLSLRFGREETTVTRWSCIVIVESASVGLVGLLADSVSQVVALSTALEPPPSFGTSAPRQFLAGMGAQGDHFLLVLNLEAVLDFDAPLIPDAPAGEATEGAAEAAPAPASEGVVGT
jgi:purine-binding chemotaxis protein CheW